MGTYWSEKETIDRLRNVLTLETVESLYGNREGNKVLLEIMERQEDSLLREKIQSQLMNGSASRYNHDRWGMTLGTRSGTVGEWGSFSESRKHNRKHRRY